MKKTLLLLGFSLLSLTQLNAQKKSWTKVDDTKGIIAHKNTTRESFPKQFVLYTVDFQAIKQTLLTAEDRFQPNAKSAIIELPTSEGKLEKFKMYEASNFDSELQAQFTDIRSYAGVGIDNPGIQVRLSISPIGIQTMLFKAGKPNDYMEVYSEDGNIYAVYSKIATTPVRGFRCTTLDEKLTNDLFGKVGNQVMSNNGKLHTFRLAMSCTGEYGTYFGSQANALAQINATLTRVNGVYEKDLAIHFNLVNNLTIIYTNPATDPYGATDANYNSELQSTLNTNVGSANYDIGHLVSTYDSTGLGNGNAGCIGCICNNANKGSGFTTRGIPVGDDFDIDFVAHEIGHQVGGNHSFTFNTEDNPVNYEVGSGVSIMGYAGITSYDVAPHSIETFHTGNIVQIQTNILTKTCDVETNLTHGTPLVNAGADWTIPKSTPFTLTGTATDTGGGSLTYQWEQYDQVDGATYMTTSSPASETKAGGPNFRDYLPTTTGVRTFPNWTSVLALSKTTAGTDCLVEALSSVARTLNFRLTVRDNVINGGQTGFDDMVVTVANKDALNVTFPAAAGASYALGSTQTLTWSGTTNATTGHQTIAGATNVDIFLSTDNGATWGYTLATNTPNDGSQSITFPAGAAGPYCRFMIKASGNIFFNVSREFALGYTVTNNCQTFMDNNPLAFVDQAPGNYTTRTLNISGQPNITSISIFNKITHTYLSDVQTDISSPANPATFVKLFNRSCGSTDGSVDLKFSNGAGGINCTNTALQLVAPSGDFTTFNGQNPNGVWTFRVYDNYAGDVGTVNYWGIEFCSQTVLASSNFVNDITDLNIYPNPNNGSFTINFKPESNTTAIKVLDIRGRNVYEKSFENNGLFNQNISLNNVESGVYLVNVQDGNRNITKKIVIE